MRQPSRRLIVRIHLILAILLTLSLTADWFQTHLIHPGGLYVRMYDPQMTLLLDSLSVYKNMPYFYVDHPGTPMQVVGSIIIALSYPFTHLKSEAHWMYHLEHPEFFFAITHALLTLGSMLTIFLLIRTTIKVKDWVTLLLSLGVGAVFFASLPNLGFVTLINWSQNSMPFPLGTLILILVVLRLRTRDPLEIWEIALLGL